MIDFHGVRLPSSLLSSVQGTYEQVEMEMIRDFIFPEDRVLLAGGGMGWLAAWCAAHLSDPLNITVFEPIPTLADLLRKNVQVDGTHLDVRNAALGTRGGEGLFHVEHNWALSGIAYDRVLDIYKSTPPQNVITVPVEDIRQVILSLQSSALILDVEGDEANLIPYLGDSWASLRRCIIEVHSFRLSSTQISDIFATIYQQGFTIKRLQKRENEDVLFFVAERIRDHGDF